MALGVETHRKEGVLGLLGGLLTGQLFGNKKDGLKKKLMDVIVRLKAQQDKLGDVVYRLETRGKELFEMAVRAIEAKDIAKATIYASEVAEIRKIAKSVKAAQLAIERLVIRLETIDVLGDFAAVLMPVSQVIKGLKQQISGIVPQVAMELDEINHQINAIVVEAGAFTEREIVVTSASEEAKRVLEEAAAVAELEIREKLPELPLTPSLPRVAASRTASEHRAEGRAAKPRKLTPDELERKVLDYIKSHNGFLDVTNCAAVLGVSKKEILEALERLKAKGKIRTIR
ncbi:TPA: cell division protein [Candidatus Micrarchaeota archaeon]|nr:cell division protein [Candidatus Micrarchaeota archaeon]